MNEQEAKSIVTAFVQLNMKAFDGDFMNEQEAKSIVTAFVQLNMKAFDGDPMAQHAVLAYHEWFNQVAPLAAVLSLLDGKR